MNLNATMIGQTISFVLFVLLCMKYVWPPLIEAIEKRQKEISDALASAEQAREAVDLAKVRAINQLEEAKAEARSIIEQANKHREQILYESKRQAEQERIRMLAQVQIEINAEYNRVREELRKQVVTLIIASAEKIIDRSINEDINRDIIDEFVTTLLK